MYSTNYIARFYAKDWICNGQHKNFGALFRFDLPIADFISQQVLSLVVRNMKDWI